MGVLDIYGFEIFEVRKTANAKKKKAPPSPSDLPQGQISDRPNAFTTHWSILPLAVCVRVLVPVGSLSSHTEAW